MESTTHPGPEQRMRADQLHAGRHQVKLGDTWRTVAAAEPRNCNGTYIAATFDNGTPAGYHCAFEPYMMLTVRQVQG